MTDQVDVLVVGAGPAGSTAAAVAARSGLRTLLVDRDTFPREKACGDGVLASCFNALREIGLDAFDSDDYFTIRRIAIKGPGGTAAQFQLKSMGEDDLRVVSRLAFDHLLYRHAIACGAETRTLNVTGLLKQEGHVIGVQAKAEGRPVEIYSKVIIAADGATSLIARLLGSHQDQDKYWAVAIRGYVATNADMDDLIEFDCLTEVQPGYAWFFPAGARYANVGVAIRSDGYKRKALSLRGALQTYLDAPEIRSRIGTNPIHNVKSWRIPVFSADRKRVFNGALLVGDAGGFVEPLTYAGIPMAVFTGKYAAEASVQAICNGDVTDGGLASFDTRWQANHTESMRLLGHTHAMVSAMPDLIDVLLQKYQTP